jgi:mannose-6-phosphate isomerase-like protein (cupin superfamily)
VVIKAGGEQTGGSLFLAETVLSPGFSGPPLHHHEKLHDMFYVLEGTLTLRLEDETVEAGPGTFVCVPPGTAHTFANTGQGSVRFLNFNTPSGWEDYMRDLAAASKESTLTPELIGSIASLSPGVALTAAFLRRDITRRAWRPRSTPGRPDGAARRPPMSIPPSARA